jgi:hypothetical protein
MSGEEKTEKKQSGIMTKERQLEISLKILAWQYRRMGTRMFMCELQLAAEEIDVLSEEMLEFFKALSDDMMKGKTV